MPGDGILLFFCAPLAPVLALLALRDCARTPGLKGRGLAIVALLVSLAGLTFFILAFLLGYPGTSGGNA